MMTRNAPSKSHLRDVIALAALAVSFSLPAHAEEEKRHTNQFELTPFAGYLGGGEFEDSAGAKRNVDQSTNLGLILNYAPEYWRAYEFLYTKAGTEIGGATKTDLDIDYLQIGGIVSNPDAKHVIPYFGLTVGAARLSPNAAGWDDETKLAFSAAGGVRVPIGDHFGVRFDARAFVTLLNNDSQIFCEVDDGATCDIRSKGDTLFQYSASLGFFVGF
jgi:outer membrane protein with beta-barrel domain